MKKTAKLSRAKTSEQITTWLAKAIVGVQRRWASWMARRTHRWGPRQQAHFLYLILLVFGGVSTYLLVDAFRGASAGTLPFDERMLAPVMPPRPRPSTGDASLKASDTTTFKRFRAYVDSVRNSADTRHLDSFLKARPHFMDSVTEAEKLIRQFYY